MSVLETPRVSLIWCQVNETKVSDWSALVSPGFWLADIKISLMNHDHVTHKLLPAAARLRGAYIVSGKYKLDNSPDPSWPGN